MLAAGECKEMPRQRSATVRCPESGLQQCSDSPVFANLCFRHFKMTDNRRQQVVEVMSDPPGQLADRFHLVGLPQLILSNSALHHFQF